MTHNIMSVKSQLMNILVQNETSENIFNDLFNDISLNDEYNLNSKIKAICALICGEKLFLRDSMDDMNNK